MASTSTEVVQVKILEVCKVQPWPPSPELSQPLTFFDIYWLKFPPVKRIYFFKLKTSPDHTTFNSLILPKLYHSLSLALHHFLPLAGNLTWPPDAEKPIILYTPNDAVPLTVAESTVSLDHLISGTNGMRNALDLHPYVPALSRSSDEDDDGGDGATPVFELQITSFPNQGFTIGYAFNHAVVDGRSITMFMEAWAYISKHTQLDENHKTRVPTTLPPEMLPIFNREIIDDPEELDMVYLRGWQGITWPGLNTKNPRSLKPFPVTDVPPNSVRATFELCSDQIKTIRERVLLFLSNQTHHLSAFVLTFAYTLACLVETKRFEGERMVKFRFPIDCRTRLEHPLLSNYFGNCVTSRAATAKAEDLMGERGVAFAAGKLSELIKGLEKGVLVGAKERFAEDTIMEAVTSAIWVAGSTQFNVYDVDFGWGKPVSTEITAIDRSCGISMTRSKNGMGGVEIGIVLKREEMEVFHSLFVTGLAQV